MKKVIAFFLICTSGFSQIKVDDVGPGWKDKVLQAIEVVRTYDIKKYNFLTIFLKIVIYKYINDR